MPRKPKKPCTAPRCPELVEAGTRFCPIHTTEQNRHARMNRTDHDEKRFYNSIAWKRLRKAKLSQDPLCERCAKEGIVRQAEVVHHKEEIREGGDRLPTLDELESLCKRCHSREHGGWGQGGV